MNKPYQMICLALATMAVGLSSVKAEGAAHHISEWRFGNNVSGAPVVMEDTKGKVVVYEYWGVRCPPCLASLPHLAKLDKKYREKGLLIIGAESQGSPKEKIEPILKNASVEYTINMGGGGPVPVSRLPHILIFNRAGDMIFEGRPSDEAFESTVKKALKEAPPASEKQTAPAVKKEANLIAQRPWTNSDGKTIHAAVVKADETSVTFLMANGKSVDYPLDKLSDESRKIIEEKSKDSK